jgi:peptidoglycan/LPS O-acetylase OafA/YrhL
LAVEEQFYIFWPWLMILIPSSYTEKIIVSVIGISILTKGYIFAESPDKWMANSYFTLSCMHALAIGALIAYWNLNRPNWIAAISKFNLVCTGVAVYFVIHYVAYFNKLGWIIEVFDNVFYAGMAALIINYAAQNKFTGPVKYVLENKFIVYSGKISYALYIFHLFVPELFWSWLSPKIGLSITSKYTAFFAFYLVTFVMAHISWILFENPINNLKRHFPYFKREEVKEHAMAGNQA